MSLTVEQLKEIIQRQSREDLRVLIEHAKETVVGWTEEFVQEVEQAQASPAPVVELAPPAPTPLIAPAEDTAAPESEPPAAA